MATDVVNDSYPVALFTAIDNYPWDADEEFQGGLRAILGSVQDSEQVEHLTLRAKCYYYAKKANIKVDFDGYRAWVDGPKNGTGGEQHVDPGQSSGGMADAPKPASFAEICDMIADGTPIPGIEDIPDTILEGESTRSQATPRKKPWEKDSTEVATPSWMA